MSDKSDFLKPLDRSYYGSKATEEAIKATGRTSQDHSTESWLLEGIVYQRCCNCHKACYPAQPLCPGCLSDQLEWHTSNQPGKVLSFTNLHFSFNEFYQERGPWPVALIASEEGPNLYAFLHSDDIKIGEEVKLFSLPDVIGEVVVVAITAHDQNRDLAAFTAKRLSISK